MSSPETQSDTKTLKYTEEFLRKFKDVKYEVSESIKKSELYIHAPKPTVNRPKVDRSRSKDGKSKSFLTPGERQELLKRRKEDEKKRFGEFREGITTPVKTPTKVRKALAPTTPNQAEGTETSVGEVQATSEEDTCTEAEDATAAILQDAQDQQLVLSVPDPEGPGSANKPEARSLLAARAKVSLQVETDERRLAQRRKQIEYGKVTHGYKCYMRIRPREKRGKREPHTPVITQKCSKRSWDGQVRKWRKQLHKYDELFPISETGGVSGNEYSDAEEVTTKKHHPPTAAKVIPSLTKEEREELARKKKEFVEMRTVTTPSKASPPRSELDDPSDQSDR
eukprot:GGOE01020638.1.p1 GENE.GGOE01020638.1~~GGOE01020638.1.p1  ORF type:complete len:338 (+),score=16.40 GGOE01020638.1:89-1102(+)